MTTREIIEDAWLRSYVCPDWREMMTDEEARDMLAMTPDQAWRAKEMAMRIARAITADIFDEVVYH